MNCENCGRTMANAASVCTFCGQQHTAKGTKEKSQKSQLTTFLLCFFFGILGVHRFYVGKAVTGILMLLTGGGFVIWAVIDLIVIACGAFKDGDGNRIH